MHALRDSLVIALGSTAIYLVVLRLLFSRNGKMLMFRVLLSRLGKIVLAQFMMRTRSNPLGAIAGGGAEALMVFWLWSVAAVFSAGLSFALAYLFLKLVS